MKLILFLIVCFKVAFNVNAQSDTIYFDGGKHYSDHIIIVPKHVRKDLVKMIFNFNPHQENYLYLNEDSSLFNGGVHAYGNKERSIHSFIIYDEFKCFIKDGYKKSCTIETFAYYPVESIETEKSIWTSELTKVYYSSLGKIVDSIYTNRFDELGKLTFESKIQFNQGVETRVETKFNNNDTLFHGQFVNNKIHGDWIETAAPIEQINLRTPSKIRTRYNYGILTQIYSSNVYFMNQQSQLVDLSTFLRICSDKESHLIKFYEFDGQNKDGGFYHFIVATANPEFLNGLSEDQIQMMSTKVLKAIKQ